MFCSKCGKEINDDAVFCVFCGAPVNAAPAADSVPQPSEPQMSVPQPVPQPAAPQPVPQPTAPQQSAPQMGMPQQGAPQMNAQQPTFTQVNNQNVNYNAPQGGMPAQPAQPVSVNLSFSLDQKMIGYINLGLRGVLAILGLLTIIGAIGTMASTGALLNGDIMAALNIPGFVGLARVPAIIAFSLALLGAIFTALTKQRSLFSYISAGVGVIMFIFNFVLLGGFNSLISLSGKPHMGGIVVAGIFLIISSLAMIACSAIIILKKEDIVPFKPTV